MRTVLVIGLGSMGRRRIRLMKTMESPPQIIGVDLSLERRVQAQLECGIDTESDLRNAISRYTPDAVLVCTSPINHESVVMMALTAKINVFTEINLLWDWYDKAIALAKRNGVELFLSSTFLYRREIEFVIDQVKGDTVNYIYHSGQYLPDWHPWESYKNFFVSDKRTNACREILSIEFPWLIKAFGEIEMLHVMRSKNSNLEVDFVDNYIISIRHRNGNKGVFCQDIISRKGIRRLEIYSEKQHIFWDGTPQSLCVYDVEAKKVREQNLYGSIEQREEYNANIIENAYREELINFFENIDGKGQPRYSFEQDKEVLRMIDRIEGGFYD